MANRATLSSKYRLPRALLLGVCLSAFGLGGCLLDRGGRRGVDAGPIEDADTQDAGIRADADPAADGGDVDAALPIDAGQLDSGPNGRPDAGSDAGSSDAGFCPLVPETCDGIDNNCNGIIDEGAACTGCRQGNLGQRSYLSCNGTRDWQAARDHCLSLGYDLVKISSAAEQSFIGTFVAPAGLNVDYWIGLNNVSGGGLSWTDGAAVSFENWKGGEPSRTGDDGCVQLTSGRLGSAALPGRWDHVGCAGALPFLCQTP